MRRKKARRKRDALRVGHARDGDPVAPRDAVSLPLVDRLAVLAVAARTPKRRRYGRAAAQLVDQLSVLFHGFLIRNIFGIVKMGTAEFSFDDPPKVFPHNDGMAKAAGKDPYAVEVGQRLRLAREALDYRVMRRFAENTGIDEDNLSNWERGVSLVPPSYVQRLKELFGITHEWIFGGDASTMRHDLARALLTTDRRK